MIQKIREDDIEIETSGINSIVGGINLDNLPNVMEIMSNNIYSNKIGSIIRELTSNCFDSHRRAKVDNPVVVNVDYDYSNETYYIEFKDVGTGLSPDAINNVYMRWFTSDKKNSNDEIGSWGLGSKSPFSYTDLFYITTVVDNIQYEYYHYKSQRNDKGVREFKLDLISENHTTKRNGTTIRIDIKSEDLEKFLKEIIEQLSYFDNVLITKGSAVSDIYGYNSNKIADFNDEKIYEYKTFKYRNKKVSEKNLFILIDTVKYPIKVEELGLDDELPFGLKFQIGELSITPSREDIEYTKSNKELIIERYNEFKKELSDLITNQNKFEFNDFSSYKKDIDEIKLILGNDKSNVKLILNKSVVKNTFGISIKKVYLPLKDFKYNISNTILDLFYSTVGYTDSNGSLIESTKKVSELQEKNATVFVINSKSELSKAKNYFINAYIIIRKKVTKHDLEYWYKSYFGYFYNRDNYQYSNKFYINEYKDVDKSNDKFISHYNYERKTIPTKTYTHKKTKLEVRLKTKTRITPLIDKAISSYQLFKHFNSLLHKQNYSSILLTPEMEKEYKDFLRSKNKSISRRENKKILCYNKWGSREEFDLSHLANKRYVFYKIRNESSYFITNNNILVDVTRLDLINFLKETNKQVIKETADLQSYEIIEISKTNFSQIKQLKNLVTFGEFFNLPMVRKQLIKKSLYSEVSDFGYLFNEQTAFARLSRVSTKFKEIQTKLNTLPRLFIDLKNDFSRFNVVDYEKYKDLEEIYHLLNQVNDINDNFEVLGNLSYGVSNDLIVEVLRYECKKLNKIQYLKHLKHYYIYPSIYLMGIIEKGNHYENLKLEKENNLIYLV